MEVLNELVGMRVIVRRREKDGDGNFSIPMNVLVGLKDGRLPEPVQMENLEVNDFIDLVFEFLDQRKWEQCSDEELFAAMEYVMEVNAHLSLVRQLGQMGVEGSSLVLFMVMLMNFMEEHDDSQNKMDIDDYFENRECLRIVRLLENGEHELMQLGLVEYACDEGQIVPYHWRLTDHAKNDVLAELGLPVSSTVAGDIRKYEDITEKKLYFNKEVTQIRCPGRLLMIVRVSRNLSYLKSIGAKR